jgi:hypothetical protein
MPNGCVIVTDRRLVLLAPKGKSPSFWLMMFGPLLGRVIATGAGTLTMTHQIEREELDSVEAPDRGMISFHSKGQGYAHVSFAVMSMTPHEVWQQRIARWLAGTLDAAALPTATVVKSKA